MPRFKRKPGLSLYRKTKRVTQKRAAQDSLSPRNSKRQCNIKTPLNFRAKSVVRKRPVTFSPFNFKRKCNIKSPWSVCVSKCFGNIKLGEESSKSKRKLSFGPTGDFCEVTKGYNDIQNLSTSVNATDNTEYSFISEGQCEDNNVSENFEQQNENDTNSNELSEINETIQLLTHLVENKRYSTTSISFKLFQDTLKWYDCENTSSMRYSEETKEFFWTGKRLLGGQFIRFMRGFAHQGLVTEGRAFKGSFNPEISGINLPVPSDRTLQRFKPAGILQNTGKQLEPGILTENIKMYGQARPDESFVVMFDGKKIVPNSADIYLLGQEEAPKKSDISHCHEENVKKVSLFMQYIENLIENGVTTLDSMSLEEKEIFLTSSKQVIYVLSHVSKSLRQIYCKKAIYLQNSEKKLEETKDGKFKWACNRIRTLMYQIRICLKEILEVVDRIMESCAYVNKTQSLFREKSCNMTIQENYLELREPDEVNALFDVKDEYTGIPTRYIKQRSPQWFSLRKDVKVTGSVAHKALGLDTLSSQREYFEKIFTDCDSPDLKEAQVKAMKHGTDNEMNAVATLVGKIMPVFYPGFTFHEEGAYIIQNEKGEKLIVVSPDGSLRNKANDMTVSVEIKCPFPGYVGATPVYYEMKPRHVIQNCLEASVLNAGEHFYISWSRESTTAFVMKPNNELVSSVVEETKHVYYGEYPCKPTKLSERAKSIKSLTVQDAGKAEFLGEFPSLYANSSARKPSVIEHIFHEPEKDTVRFKEEHVSMHDLLQNMHSGIKQLKEAYTYQKPMASEVLVYLLSDMSRTWHREIGHGLPISYLFKGYSLTMGTSRRILDEVLKACKEHGVHVPCITFDGQFARLKDYDIDDKPLTLFALQRTFWTGIQKQSKRQILNQICDLYNKTEQIIVKDTNVGAEGMLEVTKQYILVQNINKTCLPIKTSIDTLTRKSRATPDVNADEINDIGISDSAGLDEEVFSILQDASNLDDKPKNSSTNVSVDTSEGDEAVESVQLLYNTENIQLDQNDYQTIQKILSGSKRQKWKNIDDRGIACIFASAEKMNKEFTGQELNEIGKFLNLKLKKHGLSVRQNLRKAEKINTICSFIGNSARVSVPIKQHRKKSVKSLKSMCITEIMRKTYPKEAVATAFARSFWPCYREEWFETATVKQDVAIHYDDLSFNTNDAANLSPIYAPEYEHDRDQLEVRVMDGTHIRTNIKSKLIRHGLANISIHAWKKVALSGKTDLVPAMLEVQQEGKIMHQQSDPYVRTMFSEKVVSEMLCNGDENEAKFCRLFREWHQAEDQAGLSSYERCIRSLRFREWLLDSYDFHRFPPPSQYVKGIPRVTFEGLVCSIDAHILLYAMVKGGAYNWRTVSTLVAENFMGELAERSQNNHGVPSGNSLPSDMTKISELHAMRLKPDRSFQMKTAKSRSYEIPDDISPSSSRIRSNEGATEVPISSVTVRNHEFDERKARKAKHGTVRSLSEQPRGVQSVRYHYKVDESKILPSVRLGIPETSLEDFLS